MIGPPVSMTSAPRTSPSVVSIATVRTVLSPRCWATSRTRVRPALSTFSALRIDGNSPSNRTSTTAPMTWVIVPMLLVAVLVAMFLVPQILLSLRAQRSNLAPGALIRRDCFVACGFSQ